MLIQEHVDITQYPTHPRHYPDGTILIKGDLHANPLNVLYFLLQESVVTLPKEDFDTFIACYKKFSATHTPVLTEEERYQTLMQMAGIVQKLQKGDGNTIVILLGDTIGDRDENDLTMLKIDDMFDQLDLDVTIVWSNHDSRFLDVYYAYAIDPNTPIPAHTPATACFTPHENPNAQYRSVYNLFNLIDYAQRVHHHDLIVEVQTILNESYFPRLRFISCTASENSPFTDIATHAAARFESIEFLAFILREHEGKEDVMYDDSTPQALAESCERINTAMRDILNEYILTDVPLDPGWLHISEDEDHCLFDFIWKRYDVPQQQPNPNLYPQQPLRFLHGHDPNSYYRNSLSLDSLLGKINDPRFYTGTYTLDCSQPPITPSLRPPGSPVLSSTATKRGRGYETAPSLLSPASQKKPKLD